MGRGLFANGFRVRVPFYLPQLLQQSIYAIDRNSHSQ